MATSKPPKHDFAPAWLKIPQQDVHKPSGLRSSEQEKLSTRPGHRDENLSTGYNRYGDADYGCGPLQRQRSFDNYHDDHDRRYSPQKFRHHSIDDDFYGSAYTSGSGYNHGGYNYEKYGNHHRSQPFLGKYTHPNARYGGQTQSPMNGGPSPYSNYDYGYEYYGGDSYYDGFGRPLPPPGSKRDRASKQAGSGGKLDREKDVVPKEPPRLAIKELDSIEDDFPSLNGDVERPDPRPLGTSGVWEKPPNTKGMSNGNSNQPDDNQYTSTDTANKDFALSKNNNVYKAQLTTKSSISKRLSSRDLATKEATVQRDVNSNSKDGSATERKTLFARAAPGPVTERSGSEWSPPVTSPGSVSAPMEVNTGDWQRQSKESSIQGKLEKEDVSKNSAKADTKEHQDASLLNGIDDLSVGLPSYHKLSSSLEAEQRLLKEMGWNEMDNDEDCFITEEEIREFQKLKELKAESKNGFCRPGLPKVWSPKQKTAVLSEAMQDLNDTLSSTSDDSDSDLD